MDEDLKSASASIRSDQPHVKPSPVSNYKPKSKRGFKMFLIALCVIIFIILAGFAVWYLFLNKTDTNTPEAATDQPAAVQSTTTVSSKDILDATPTETYSSTALSVGFKYPKAWKVTEANGGIRVESPAFKYTASQAGETEGNFRVYIRQGARAVDGPYIGRGQAIKASEKLTYTQPATGQRTETLISSFGFDSSNIFSFVLIAGNFQLNKDDTLGPDYGKEPDTYIVTGGYATPAATDDFAYSSVPLAYYATTNAYKQGMAIIASLQLK